MKNYYKILGVKENASEEEIREHWIELMKNLHPDLSERNEVNEKVKEINEAYQILKFSSTRVEYDLKRAFHWKNRRFYLKRLTIPISIFAVLVVFGSFYFKRSQVAIQPKEVSKVVVQESAKIAPKEIEKVEETKPATIKPPLAFLSVAERELKSGEKPFKAMKSEIPVKVKEMVPKEISKVVIQESGGIVSREVPRVEETKPTTQEPSVIPALTVVQSETPVNSSSYQINQIDSTTQMTQQRDDISIHQRIDASPILIATEEEVRRFFANYTERYTRKDLDGFLSLFSPKAVQNSQDGLEGIRKIYGNFLKQSQEIKYYMDDIKIEIYQNGVEVKARYEIIQTSKRGDKKLWRGDIRWTLVKEDGALKILSLDYQHQKSP